MWVCAFAVRKDYLKGLNRFFWCLRFPHRPSPQPTRPASQSSSVKTKTPAFSCTKWKKNKSNISFWFQFSAVFGLFRIRSTKRLSVRVVVSFFFGIHSFALFFFATVDIMILPWWRFHCCLRLLHISHIFIFAFPSMLFYETMSNGRSASATAATSQWNIS